MLKKLFAAILLAGFSFTVFSQNVEGINARIDAMAGCGMISDIGWAIGEPVQIVNYPDILSASLYATPIPDVGESFGAIIGVKSIGEHVRIGLTMNDRLQMPYAFYKDGGYYLDAKHINGDNHAEKFPMYPSLAFAVKFNDDFSFGCGGWVEGQRYSLEDIRKVTYVDTGGVTRTVEYQHNEIDKRIGFYGFVVDAWVALGGLHLRPSFGYGFPFMTGTEDEDQLTQLQAKLRQNPAPGPQTGVNYDIEWDMPSGTKMKGGLLGWFMAGDHEVAFGAWFTDLKYQFQRTTTMDSTELSGTGVVVSSFDTLAIDQRTDRHNLGIDWFLGISPSFADNLIFAPEYNGGFGTTKAKDPALPPDTSWLYTYHNFRLGIEKGVPDVWIFDKLFFRSGVVMYLAKELRTIYDGDDQTTESVENIPWASYFWGSEFGRRQAKLAGGLGVKKGRAEFDVSVDFLAWKGQGIIAGPNCAMVTLKVDFGTNKEF
jgi:hypothetical protein